MNIIYTHLITFATGLLTGILGSYIANRLSAKAKKRDESKERKNEFSTIIAKMPNLISEMKEDLSGAEMKSCREFFISPKRSVGFNNRTPAFFYYEDEHENLSSKIRILESSGFVYDITPGDSPKYQFVEEFVERILNLK
ncbi:hypothetical protein [Ancylomarina sp. 16SWW S1-10-2]|uniref:hypothetical protein n=1 Tax=Ancylomarina sp. 16SWW S1-10-2 TaxID=2499681 RepID=UPI0012ADA226|nr:hypothetical protein [Ancylomarina sp. 16SWW S1-10-2]MRT93631.1 hypothetical protein [Ancylomarina sp. 16SWW S1-10-2]